MSKPNGHINGEAEEHARPVGRPRLDLSADLIEDLAGIGCTMIEIAKICKCSVDTLERNFAEVIEKGREEAKVSLRRKQLEVAHKGNPALLIWLGKQLLDQRDKQELSGPGGGPIQHEHINYDSLTDEQLSELERLVESATCGDRAGSASGTSQP